MRDAHLEGANLRFAHLEGAHFDDAHYDARTRWPQGFDPALTGARPADEE